MKQHFVLDENIIVLAYKAENEQEKPDPTCQELLLAIERNCHALVFCPSFWDKYGSQVRRLQQRRIPLTPRIMSIIQSLVANLDKDTRFVPDHELTEIDELDGLPSVDIGDRDFVRAAATVPGAILVTTDGRLTTAITARGIDIRFGFRVLSPREALPMAGPDVPDGNQML
jgi:hypothetical protein